MPGHIANGTVDNCPRIDAKAIRSITVTSDDTLNGLSITYDDGSETLWHGGEGGKRHQFALAAGEDITQVFVSWSETAVEGLQFITSKGMYPLNGCRRSV